jgi:hypothetical protein
MVVISDIIWFKIVIWSPNWKLGLEELTIGGSTGFGSAI